jgi:replicative superfamily II helicase
MTILGTLRIMRQAETVQPQKTGMEELREVLGSYVCEQAVCEHLFTSIQRALDESPSRNLPKGCLVQAPTGGGKTGLLTGIANVLGMQTCLYLDCARLQLGDRY